MGETLGGLLRQKRESLGLTLEKVEGFTRIRIKHLQAIESDDLSSIPSVPQARGFIRNYAAFLGIDPEEIAAHTGGARPQPSQKPPAPAPAAPAPKEPEKGKPPPPTGATRPRASITAPVVSRQAGGIGARPVPAAPLLRNWLRLDVLLGAMVTLAVLALLGWGGYHIALSIKEPAAPSLTESIIPGSPQPAAADTPSAGLTPAQTGSETDPAGAGTPSLAADEQTPPAGESGSAVTTGIVSLDTPIPTAFPTPLGGVYTDVRIHIVVVLRAYLQVDVDGKTVFAGRVQPDDTFDYVGQRTVAISTGNGAGIRVIFNGIDDGPMGRFGEVVARTYTPTGVLTPVPSVTFTPTITPTPADTPVP
ncbi:MAG: helix-turn-helix domain-containing protein [Anaerolineales bacterium]|nr:helix-turn-helix domain-containing protein [Anaerolineales bacterium]